MRQLYNILEGIFGGDIEDNVLNLALLSTYGADHDKFCHIGTIIKGKFASEIKTSNDAARAIEINEDDWSEADGIILFKPRLPQRTTLLLYADPGHAIDYKGYKIKEISANCNISLMGDGAIPPAINQRRMGGLTVRNVDCFKDITIYNSLSISFLQPEHSSLLFVENCDLSCSGFTYFHATFPVFKNTDIEAQAIEISFASEEDADKAWSELSGRAEGFREAMKRDWTEFIKLTHTDTLKKIPRIYFSIRGQNINTIRPGGKTTERPW